MNGEKLVFVVDEDPSVKKALERLLNSAGMNTEAYASASDFLEFGSCDSNGCLILDVKMKDITSRELHQKLIQEGCEKTGIKSATIKGNY